MTDLGLRRNLGLAPVTFIAIGFMVGGGVFVFSPIVLDITGPALPLAYALAAVPVFVAMLPLAMLGAAIPCAGASYRYPSRLVSSGLAFTGVWVYALASFFGQIPLYALGCASYLKTLVPALPEVPVALAIVTALYLLNVLGVRLAAQIQGALVVVLVGALLLYTGGGVATFEASQLGGLLGCGAGGLALGTALLAFTYFGANGIIELGGEIVRPGWVIPRAFAIAFPVVALLYIGVALATVATSFAPELVDMDEPLVAVALLTTGRIGATVFVLCGAVVALLTTLNALFIVGTRSLLVIVEDGLLPAWLGRIHPRYRTPHVLLTVIWLLSVGGLLSGFSLETLASYAALGGLIIFGPLQIASLRLRSRLPRRYAASRFKLRGVAYWLCPIVGLVTVLFFSLVILVDMASLSRIAIFAGFVISGVAVYTLRSGQLRAQGRTARRSPADEGWG